MLLPTLQPLLQSLLERRRPHMVWRSGGGGGSEPEISVTVPTQIPCTMMADGTVIAPSNLFIGNSGDALVVDAYTADIMGNDIDYALNIGSSSALTRAEGKDTAPICGIDLNAGSNELLALKISRLNRRSNAALINSVNADNATDMFKLGFRFTPKSLFGNVTIAGDTLVGSTLTVNTSGLQPDVVPSYQWYRDGVKISGAVDKTYVIVDEDSAREIICKVTDASGKYADELVSNIIIPEKPVEAFAIYSADDNSLNFYKRPEMPLVGTPFEGKTVTEVFTGFEDAEYSSSPWYVIKDSIANVKFVDEVKPKSTAHWFEDCRSIISFDFSKLDTSAVINMSDMFHGCWAIKNLDLSSFNTSEVLSMSNMFFNCYKLTALDLSSFNTSKVRSMADMFCNTNALTSLDLSSFNTSAVRSMYRMFNFCGVRTLDLSSFDTSAVTNMTSMFAGCSWLKTLDLSNFDTSAVKEKMSMFANCLRLQQVKLGNKCTIRNLPTPSATYIYGADGKWYAMSDGKGYVSIDVPSNKADTYSAVPPKNFAQAPDGEVGLVGDVTTSSDDVSIQVSDDTMKGDSDE